MVAGRIKFEVWSPEQKRWRVAYVRPELAAINYERMRAMGYLIRMSHN
jgi:mannose/fructose/N-acetylgalactosamine-specific phosphotransferase system component IID